MSFPRRLLFFAFLATVFVACGGPQIPPAQNYGAIRGRVYDVATNQPIAGVVVTTFTILSATSGADGTYRIGNIPAGQYSVQPSNIPPGYSLQAGAPGLSGSIALGETITVDIPLTKQ